MPVFLFTDIEGSTRLREEHTDVMLAVIARHDTILREQIEASGGRTTKHTGDGVTAVFPGMLPEGDLPGAGRREGGEPLACALEMQRQFAAEAWGAIGLLRIRVGLHAGAAELHAGDYFGPPVNTTARIMSAAWGGQILLTPQVISSSPLPSQATLVDLGEHMLKNVSAPQQICQLAHPDLARVEFPPPRSLSGRAIGQTVGQQAQQLADMEPETMAVSLVSATLLPALLGDLPSGSPVLAANVGVLRDLGAEALAGFLALFAGHVAHADPEELRQQLERELQQRWPADAALRADASRLLRAVKGVDATLAAATGEVREALARGLAGVGSQFDEFGWMLGDVQETLAEAHPLVLILDNLQWADTASIGLLFHLGRRLEGARILIAGAYRPVEVALGRGGERHPLQKVLNEFRRAYGDVWLDLGEVEERERRHFVDAFLKTEPNCPGEDFGRSWPTTPAAIPCSRSNC